ncbi:uncharacterized protein LOC134207514 [Armigeres subalbatus]|uniref:uncharacterized protein LOC134207514 n=1 Tax=Armigeres subalbatus TaxID=124917 RepID=UPI002ED44F5A
MKLILALVLIVSHFDILTMDMNQKVTSHLIAEIIDEYYVLQQTPILVLGDTHSSISDLISQIIRNFRQPRIVQLNSTIYGHVSWFYNVFVFRSYEYLKIFVHQLGGEDFDLFGYYTIVINEVNEEQIFNVFNTFWKLKILRVVLTAVNGDEPQLYYYTPFSDGKCDEPTIHLAKNSIPEQLFMHDLNDFQNCPLRLSTFEMPPFIRFGPSVSNRSRTVSGFEGDLVNTLTTQLNFRLEIVTPPDNADWGEVRRHNSTGMMGALQNGHADFGIGCLGIIPQRNEILQHGRPHYTSRILFAVPEGIPLSAFEKLFRPFRSAIWFTSLIITSLFAVFVLILKFTPKIVRDFIYGGQNHTPFLNYFNVYFTGVINRLPQRNFARTLLLLWIVHCFIIRSLYQGSLFKYLQADSKHKAVETMHEIEQSKLYYYIFKISERFFQNNPRVLGRVRYLKPGNNTLNVRIEALATGKLRDGVLLVTLEHLAYHNTYNLDKGFVRCTRDAISAFPMVMYYPKRTFLVRVMNRVIGSIETAGLMGYWIRRYGNYQFFPSTLDKGKAKPLRNYHLMGCYQSMAVLWAAACAIFLLEVVSVRVAWNVTDRGEGFLLTISCLLLCCLYAVEVVLNKATDDREAIGTYLAIERLRRPTEVNYESE